jgi:hypothetical protein
LVSVTEVIAQLLFLEQRDDENSRHPQRDNKIAGEIISDQSVAGKRYE